MRPKRGIYKLKRTIQAIVWEGGLRRAMQGVLKRNRFRGCG